MSASKVVLNILSVCISLLFFVLVLFGFIKLGTVSYDMGYRIFTEQPQDPAPGRDVVVEISSGMSAHSIGVVMEEKGLVDNAWLFTIQMKLFSGGDSIKPGLYTLNTSQTAKELLAAMSAKQEASQEDEASDGKDSE